MSISKLKGETVDALLWTDVTTVESQALDQLRNIASLPWVAHVAVMPDVHFGKGATVGSVIGMRGAVSPAAVGVDIGCFTGDTKIPMLDGKDYPIKELVGKEIFTYACTEGGKVVATKAIALLTRKAASLVKVILDNGEEIRCTPDQRFMLRTGAYLEAEKLQASTSLMPFYSDIDAEGYKRIQQNYSGRWQRGHWLVARSGLLGPIPSFEGQKTIIHHKEFNRADNWPSKLQFMGHKDHSKYHRSLSDRNTYWQSEAFEKARIAAFRAKAKTEEGHKFFAERGTKNLLKYLAEKYEDFRERVKPNGQRGKKYLIDYNKSEKGRRKSAELGNREYLCTDCEEVVKSPLAFYAHKRLLHQKAQVPKNEILFHNHKVVAVVPLEEKEDVYCLQVPELHNFALTAGVFVHNCGMGAIKTGLKEKDLPDNLAEVRKAVERAVPVGPARHDKVAFTMMMIPFALRTEAEKLMEDFKTLSSGVQHEMSRAAHQLGTMGGGNHFIELCVDDDQNVWLMLHSGSRWIGKELAEIHMDVAMSLKHNQALKDRDLSVFLSGTPEMQAYRHDLMWAQRYAMINRKVMMNLYLNALVSAGFPEERLKPEMEVWCHHNYVAEEKHFGEDLIVTRKGAIRAGVGEFGIIPGSMGTGSYIVEGLGNPEALCSASHGAGRKMSRSKAKKSFTLEDLKAQTKGIECRKDWGVIDEIPGAYKDIDKVIDNQKDLVRVVAHLTQRMNVKGGDA